MDEPSVYTTLKKKKSFKSDTLINSPFLVVCYWWSFSIIQKALLTNYAFSLSLLIKSMILFFESILPTNIDLQSCVVGTATPGLWFEVQFLISVMLTCIDLALGHNMQGNMQYVPISFISYKHILVCKQSARCLKSE